MYLGRGADDVASFIRDNLTQEVYDFVGSIAFIHYKTIYVKTATFMAH